jgi:hypothetical protein
MFELSLGLSFSDFLGLLSSGSSMIPLLAAYFLLRASRVFEQRHLKALGRSRSISLVVGVICALISIIYYLPPTNLVRNPGFESHTRYWGTGYFETLIQNGRWPADLAADLPLVHRARAQGGYDTSQAPRGSGSSYWILQESPAGPDVWSSISQQIAGLNRETTYQVRYAVKAENLPDNSLFLALDPKWSNWQCRAPRRTYDWQIVSCDPFNTGRLEFVEFRFVLQAPAKAWVSGAMFYELTWWRRVLCRAPNWLRDVSRVCP